MKLPKHYLLGFFLLSPGFFSYAVDNEVGRASLKNKEGFFSPQADSFSGSQAEIALSDWARVGGATEVASTKKAIFSKLPIVAVQTLTNNDEPSKQKDLIQTLKQEADRDDKSINGQDIERQERIDHLTRTLKEEESGLNKLKTGTANRAIQIGTASWYGYPFHGRKTASGERYNMYKMTAAHKNLPLNSVVKVTNLINHQSVVVKINDRGPYVGKRILDLSYAAAKRLGIVAKGTGTVLIKRLR